MMLNPDLDIDGLTSEFGASNSLVIDNYLKPDYAELLQNWLDEKMPEHWWFASYRATASGKGYEGTKFINHSSQNKESIDFEKEKANYSLSKGHFAYMFDRTLDDHGKTCSCIECEFRKFLASDAHLLFLSTITNEWLTRTDEFFASRYTAGQFLGPHHDLNKGKIGFILNLTKDWRPEHGGLLHMLDKDYMTVEKTILPVFNRLTIFHIPSQHGIPHFVSHVNPAVKVNRISYTGWFS
jgi:SM-20-related protein